MEHISLNPARDPRGRTQFKQNNVKIPKDAKLDLKPSFSRRVRKTPDNEKLHFVTLEVKIESSETSPKPFDLKVCLTGVFEAEVGSDFERRAFNVQAVAILYPYLRAAVTNLTGAAFVAPLVLPWWAARSFPRTGNRPKSFRTDFHLGDTIRKMGEKSGRIVNRLTLL